MSCIGIKLTHQQECVLFEPKWGGCPHQIWHQLEGGPEIGMVIFIITIIIIIIIIIVGLFQTNNLVSHS